MLGDRKKKKPLKVFELSSSFWDAQLPQDRTYPLGKINKFNLSKGTVIIVTVYTFWFLSLSFLPFPLFSFFLYFFHVMFPFYYLGIGMWLSEWISMQMHIAGSRF